MQYVVTPLVPPLTTHCKEHTDSYPRGSRKEKKQGIYFFAPQNLFDSSTVTWALGAVNARPGRNSTWSSLLPPDPLRSHRYGNCDKRKMKTGIIQ